MRTSQWVWIYRVLPALCHLLQFLKSITAFLTTAIIWLPHSRLLYPLINWNMVSSSLLSLLVLPRICALLCLNTDPAFSTGVTLALCLPLLVIKSFPSLITTPHLDTMGRFHGLTPECSLLQALLTGSLPGFIDVVRNLNSPTLLEDNVITRAKAAGKRIIFYGDETWVKLFPKHFVEYDGTTSFFVSDYTEVSF